MPFFTSARRTNDFYTTLISWAQRCAQFEGRMAMSHLTIEDIVNCFVREDHRDLIMRCADILDIADEHVFECHYAPRGTTSEVTNPKGVRYKVITPYVQGAKAWFRPRYCGAEFLAPPDDPARVKIEAALQKRYEIGREWGLVSEVLQRLCSGYRVAEAMYLFPALPPVLNTLGYTDLAGARPKPIEVGRAFMDACEDASATATRATIMRVHMDKRPEPQQVLVVPTVTSVRWHKYDIVLTLL